MLVFPSLIVHLLYVSLCFCAPKLGKENFLHLGQEKASDHLPKIEFKESDGIKINEILEPSKNASFYTKIFLFSRTTGENYTELIFGNTTNLRYSAFDANKATKILIHGWRGSGFTSFEETLRKTYLSAQDVNLLEVDWSKRSYELYDQSRAAVVPVGKFVAYFVDWLATETKMSVGNIHIIGHSLGAHISGVVGEYVTSGKIGRISGLDPARPGFFNSTTSDRLDSSDAMFVDIIHTCSGEEGIGFSDPCGHVDFYPNRGTPPQPGCLDIILCSHIRAYELFNESITSDQFISTPCSSWEEFRNGVCSKNITTSMGEKVDVTARGIYYLHTKRSYPFADGKKPTISSQQPHITKEEIQELFYKNGTIMHYPGHGTLEQSPSEYVKVYFHSRKTGDNYSEIIYKNMTSFKSSAFDIYKPTKMLIHGWLANALGDGSYEEELRKTYLSAQDVNVLSVDWSKVADDPVYTLARAKVVPVGKFVAQFLDWLVSEAGVFLDTVHLIGHSLGAHVSGVVGEYLTVGNISRISGLDPAGPGFFNSTISGRLDSTDAQFVDVIHTCANFAGFYDPCGHVDFYPNRGEPPQPGCDILLALTCSHIRSHDLFNESIISTNFLSWQCDDWSEFANGSCYFNEMTIMGEHVNINARGMYYLHTNKTFPYALGDVWGL